MKRKILIIGNASETFDSYPVKILNKLMKSFPNEIFIPWDPSEELPSDIGDSIICIDTVTQIQQPTIFTDIDDFMLSPRNTVHDFDLLIALRFLLKLKKIQKVVIIGVPTKQQKNTYPLLCTILRSI